MRGPSSTPTEALRAEGAAASLGPVRALDGVSLAVSAGEVVALAGPNGAGKSTLLRALTGLLPLDEGRVQVLGMDPRRDAARLRPRLAYAEQHPALDPEATVAETLRLFHTLAGLPAREREARTGRAAVALGLAALADRRVAACSGGERQRLHLAAALLPDPRVVLLDEPTSALDPEGRGSLRALLAQRRAAGGAVLLSTHDLGEAAHADRVVLLHRGRVAAEGTPAALVAAHGRARATVVLAGGAEAARGAAALAALPGAEVEVEGASVTLWREAPANAELEDPVPTCLRAAGLAPRRYERVAPDLASVFHRLTGSAPGGTGRERGRGGGGAGGRRRRG